MAGLEWDGWLTLIVVALMVAAMAGDRLAPALAVLGADIVLLVTGVIDAGAAFSGFSNPAPITVAALFVVARAVESTGALRPLVAAGVGTASRGRRWRLLRLLGPTAASSAVLNNTAVVAMLAPAVARFADERGEAASRFLIPLSFATILGGTVTLIGTSTNLVVSGLLEAEGMRPLGMFELSSVGVPIAVLGLVLITLLAPRLLPDRRPPRRDFAENAREYVVHHTVATAGPLDGRSIEDARLRRLQGVFLAEVERDGQVIVAPPPTTVLQGGDRLTFAGRVDRVRDLQAMPGLLSEEHEHSDAFGGPEHTFFEAVLSGSSSLAGATLRQASFRSRFQAAVIGIHRSGERVREKLGEVKLREGDTLLLLSDPGFEERWRDRAGEFLLVSHLGGSLPASTPRAAFVVVVTVGMITAAALGLLPILHAALLAAVAVVVGGALSLRDARRALDLDVLVLIAAAFGIGAALEQSGLAGVAAEMIAGGASWLGAIGVLVAIAVVTIVLTELITNNAAAVLMFPIAVAAAQQLGIDPRAFAVAITIAASASFLTPIGYQTNTMVYGLGGYRFGDYVRLGTPLTLLVVVAIALIVPLFWPIG